MQGEPAQKLPGRQRRTERESEVDPPGVANHPLRSSPAHLRRRGGEDFGDGLVELPDAVKSGTECDIGEGQRCGFDQSSRRASSPGSSQRLGTAAHLLREDSLQVAAAHRQLFGQTGDAVSIHDTILDRSHRPGDEIVSPIPFRRTGRRIRGATLARPEAGLLGGGRGREEAHVGAFGSYRGRARRAAVDAGRRDPERHPAIEACIAALDRSHPCFERFGRGNHSLILSRLCPLT